MTFQNTAGDNLCVAYSYTKENLWKAFWCEILIRKMKKIEQISQVVPQKTKISIDSPNRTEKSSSWVSRWYSNYNWVNNT